MGINRGKQFEEVVEKCANSVEGAYVLRLYDPQGGYSGVANPCDFILYRNGIMYMVECKSVHGNLLTIYGTDPKKAYGNISNTQWNGLLKAHDKGIVAGILCWWIDKDVTVFIPIEFLQEYRKHHKSIHYGVASQVEWTDNDGNPLPDNPVIIKGTKKRVLFDYDFEDFFKQFEISC